MKRRIDTNLKRPAAIKVLPPSLVSDRDRLARFQREVEVLASLNHPNIAAVYGLEESDGITAVVMELVEGDDLSTRIARGAIPADEALPIEVTFRAAGSACTVPPRPAAADPRRPSMVGLLRPSADFEPRSAPPLR